MIKRIARPLTALSAVIAAVHAIPALAAGGRCTPAISERVYPGKEWSKAAPASHGWSEAGLKAAWQRAARSFSAGMLIHRGRVIGEFGDVAKPMETRSMRKSLLNIVIGQLVERRRLRLDATLSDLGIDDVSPLTQVEKSATLRDLLTSRSGVYAPAAYVVPGDEAGVPARGSHKPGEAFFYWNWGFNALGGIVERTTGQSLFKSIERTVARPLGFEDFNRARDTRYVREPVSRFPAYLLDLSTRDRARLGLLFLNQGCWKGRQIVSPQWVRDSVHPHTDQTTDFDYGYLWWSTEPPKNSGLAQRMFMARGFANQYIVGIPEIDTVLVISVDMAMGQKSGLRPPRRSDFEAVFDQVLRSRPGQQQGTAP